MSWLLRQEIKKPLFAKNFALRTVKRGVLAWEVDLQGPAARYFRPSPEWEIKVCGTKISPDEISAQKSGADEWRISGTIFSSVSEGQRCTLEVFGKNQAFGSLKANISEMVPETFSDKEVAGSQRILEKLSSTTGAKLVLLPRDKESMIIEWLETVTTSSGVALPDRFKTIKSFYWVLEHWWFYLLLIFLPIEVIIRRWDIIGTHYYGRNKQ